VGAWGRAYEAVDGAGELLGHGEGVLVAGLDTGLVCRGGPRGGRGCGAGGGARGGAERAGRFDLRVSLPRTEAAYDRAAEASLRTSGCHSVPLRAPEPTPWPPAAPRAAPCAAAPRRPHPRPRRHAPQAQEGVEGAALPDVHHVVPVRTHNHVREHAAHHHVSECDLHSPYARPSRSLLRSRWRTKAWNLGSSNTV
jgi:hypothetical protein